MPVHRLSRDERVGLPAVGLRRAAAARAVGKDEDLAKVLSLLHWCGAIAIILLIAAHLTGVIYHTFIRRDGLLQRMM